VSGRVPKDPAHCRYCLTERGAWTEKPCEDHARPDGSRGEYSGPELYEPSEWVKSVVGKLYTAGRWTEPKPGQKRQLLVEIFGYDRRCGFWVREVDVKEDGTREIVPDGYFSNISERAVGVNYVEWNGRPLQ
jgi:hypothetical protein